MLTNQSRVLHNISLPDQAIDQDVAPGETVAVQVHMDKHTLGFNCKYTAWRAWLGRLCLSEVALLLPFAQSVSQTGRVFLLRWHSGSWITQLRRAYVVPASGIGWGLGDLPDLQ